MRDTLQPPWHDVKVKTSVSWRMFTFSTILSAGQAGANRIVGGGGKACGEILLMAALEQEGECELFAAAADGQLERVAPVLRGGTAIEIGA